MLYGQHALMKQTNMDDPYDQSGDDDISGDVDDGHASEDELPPTPPRPSTPEPAKGLPWTPKVRLVHAHSNSVPLVFICLLSVSVCLSLCVCHISYFDK